jgi:hypothetical protein
MMLDDVQTHTVLITRKSVSSGLPAVWGEKEGRDLKCTEHLKQLIEWRRIYIYIYIYIERERERGSE